MKTWQVVKELMEGTRKLTRKPFQYEGYFKIEDETLWYHSKNMNMWITNDIKQIFENDWVPFEEQTFSKGDKVINERSNVLHKIVDVMGEGKYRSENGTVLHESNLRKATCDEIKKHEEIQKWKKWGRKVNEYRVGDIVKVRSMIHLHEVTGFDEDLILLDGGEYQVTVDQLTMICLRGLREPRI